MSCWLLSITLTAATVCTARACTKRLDETQWPETYYWDVSTETTSLCWCVAKNSLLTRSLIPRLHDEANMKQTQSTSIFASCLHASSCKRDITLCDVSSYHHGCRKIVEKFSFCRKCLSKNAKCGAKNTLFWGEGNVETKCTFWAFIIFSVEYF